MTLPAILTNAPAIAVGAFAASAWLSLFTTWRRAARVKRTAERLRHDAEFVVWASWTYVSVLDREGKLFHCSITDLRDELAHFPDKVWAVPKATIIYESSPDDPDPYGYKEESTGGRPGGSPRRRAEGPVSDHRTQDTSDPTARPHRPDERAGKALHPEG